MTVDDLRVLVTVVSFAAFVGIVLWACSRRRGKAFDTAARLPFDGGEDERGASR